MSAPPSWPAPSSAFCTPATPARNRPSARREPAATREPDIEIQGIGDLLSTYARCCKPVPPEAIVGYITVGRGVSIHAQILRESSAGCASSRRRRVLAVGWGKTGTQRIPRWTSKCRPSTGTGWCAMSAPRLADAKIGIQGMNTVTDKRDNVAHMLIKITITGLPQLSQVLAASRNCPTSSGARRKK